MVQKVRLAEFYSLKKAEEFINEFLKGLDYGAEVDIKPVCLGGIKVKYFVCIKYNTAKAF